MEGNSKVVVSSFFCNVIKEDESVFNDGYNEKLCEACERIEEYDLYSSLYDEQLYNICEEVENDIEQAQGHGKLTHKRSSSTEDNSSTAKRVKYEGEVSTSSVVKCKTCDVSVSKWFWENHLQTDTHKNNALKVHYCFENVLILDFTVGHKIISYKIKSKDDNIEYKTSVSFLNSVKDELLFLIQESLLQNATLKVNFILHANFTSTSEINQDFHFQTCNFVVMQGHDFNTFILVLSQTLTKLVLEFEKKDNGCNLKEIKSMVMTVNKTNPHSTTYYELPENIKRKKAVINVKNSDNLCFKWSLLSALYPVNHNSDRVTSYSMHANKLKFAGIKFPVELTDIPKIENLNNLSINVYGVEYDNVENIDIVVGPLYVTSCRKDVHINLLYVSHHYCYIKNLSRLVSSQLSNQKAAFYICDGCLLYFPTQHVLNYHQQTVCSYEDTNLPNSGMKLKIGSACNYKSTLE